MNNATENSAISGKIIPTFFYYVIPSIIGLVAITTANLVDGMFVGNAVGGNALAVITILIPYLTFLYSIALMLAIGGSVRAGKYVGEEDLPSASAIFSKSLIAIVAINLVSAVGSFAFESQLYTLLNAPESLHSMMSEYFGIIRWVMIVQLFTMVLYYFVRADGHPMLATVALVCGALINIVLDALFILHYDMGLAGAAYATAIAQTIQFFVLTAYFFSPARSLKFQLPLKGWNEILLSAYNGVSEFINEMSVGLIFLLLNWLIISRIGVDGVAAFSIVNYFIFLSVMLSYGIADALHVLVSQNFGAQKYIRIQHFLNTALVSSCAIGAILVLIILGWQDTAITWFIDSTQSEQVVEMAGSLLLIVWPLFLVNGVNIVFSVYLTAIHQPKPSSLISILRSLALPGFLLTSLYYLFEAQTETWSFLIALPVAEWCTFTIAIALCYHYRPTVITTKTLH